MISIPENIGYVYSIDVGNGKVKVGCSRDPSNRVYQLSKTIGLDNPPFYISKKCLDYRKAESDVHEILGGRSKFGEFFSASLSESIAIINSVVVEITDDIEIEEARKESAIKKKQSESIASIMSKFESMYSACDHSEEYNAIINDAVSWCDNFDIDMIDKLMECNGSVLCAMSTSLLIHKEVIKKYSEAISTKELK